MKIQCTATSAIPKKMKQILIKQASIVNEGSIQVLDLLIIGERIAKIEKHINATPTTTVINAEGLFLLPGVIDDHVHFREPGLTHKGSIYSESMAAVAGGITSYMDMPNTLPNVLTIELLEEKYALAAKNSVANFSFFMGVNQYNLEEALKINNEHVCGITDDGLYFNSEEGILANYPTFLEQLFSKSDSLIALHSENDAIINSNTKSFRSKYGNEIPIAMHAQIRSEAACVTATKNIIELANKNQNRVHILHVSTLAEANLMEFKTPIRQKRLTAEVCIHHLWFSDQDYEKLGAKIKWNPSVKTEKDKHGLLQALIQDQIDIIASDHAPHTLSEKSGNYFNAHSGGPLVQHALLAILEFYKQGKIPLTSIAKKMAHHVADLYRIKDRGYIREGYFADLVLVNTQEHYKVDQTNLLYYCKWSPFEDTQFSSTIVTTFVNGHIAYDHGQIYPQKKGMRLQFEKER